MQYEINGEVLRVLAVWSVPTADIDAASSREWEVQTSKTSVRKSVNTRRERRSNIEKVNID